MFKPGTVIFFDGQGVIDPDCASETASFAAAEFAASPGIAGSYTGDFAALVKGWGIKYFNPSELLTMSGSHNSPGSPAFGKNAFPPREMWPVIRPSIVAWINCVCC